MTLYAHCNGCSRVQAVHGDMKLPPGYTAYHGKWLDLGTTFTLHACEKPKCIDYARRETAEPVLTPF